MLLPAPLTLCVGGVFCSSLLALHMLWLATLHRRSRPTVLSGPADFAATLTGLGGFVFALRPAAAAVIREAPAYGRPDTLDAVRDLVAVSVATGPVLWQVVGVGLVTAVAVGVWRRRDSLAVHHIDAAAVPQAVAEAAVAAGLEGTDAVTWGTRPRVGHATIRVRHLDPAAARDLLAHLRTRLAAAPPPDRSPGGWYTAAAGGLLGCTVTMFVAFFWLTRAL